MSLPTGSDLATLSWVSEGQPLATYQPSTANTLTLSFVSDGQPFYAQGAGSGGAAPAARPVVFVAT
jgi:hypothetical protein